MIKNARQNVCKSKCKSFQIVYVTRFMIYSKFFDINKKLIENSFKLSNQFSIIELSYVMIYVNIMSLMKIS